MQPGRVKPDHGNQQDQNETIAVEETYPHSSMDSKADMEGKFIS
jgi:hypothetical protein